MFQFFRFVQYNISHRCKVSFHNQHHCLVSVALPVPSIPGFSLPAVFSFLYVLYSEFLFFSVFSFTILSTEEPVVIFLLSFFTHPAIFIIQKSIQTPRIIHFFLLISSSPHHPSCYTTDKECCHICSHDSRANRCSGKYG